MPTEFLPRTYGNSAAQARISGLHAPRFPRGCVIYHILGVPVISNEVRNPTVTRGRRRGRFLPTVEMTASLIRGFHTASPAGEAHLSWHPDGRSKPPGRLVKNVLTFPLKREHVSSKTCSRFQGNASTFFHASLITQYKHLDYRAMMRPTSTSPVPVVTRTMYTPGAKRYLPTLMGNTSGIKPWSLWPVLVYTSTNMLSFSASVKS